MAPAFAWVRRDPLATVDRQPSTEKTASAFQPSVMRGSTACDNPIRDTAADNGAANTATLLKNILMALYFRGRR